MMVEEAEQLVCDYLPLPADRRLPDGWLVNIDNVPVAPPLTGQARLDYIRVMWDSNAVGVVTEEERSRLPPFNASAVYWTSWWMPSMSAASTPSPPPASSGLTTCPMRSSHLFRLQAAPVIDIATS